MPNLLLAGSPTFNGDSSCTINSTDSDRVSVPDVSLLNKTQAWVAIRFKTTWASTEAVEHTFFRWGPNTNDEIFIQYGATVAAVACGREAAGSSIQALINPVPAFAAGDTVTAIGAWTATEVKISWLGSVFTTIGNTDIPTLEAATVWDIGQRGYSATAFLNGDVFWAAAGLGTLSDANAATIHALGNTDTGLAGFPFAASFFWAANDGTYEPVVLRSDYSKFPKAILRPPVPVRY